MSEYLHHFDNGQPYFAFNTQMGAIVATPDNTTVFKHDFEWAGADHIFAGLDYDETESDAGIFLWRIVANKMGIDLFDGVTDEMEQEGFDVIRRDMPDEHDMWQFQVYLNSQIKKVTNKKLKGWLNG